jgi:hypothetical protein
MVWAKPKSSEPPRASKSIPSEHNLSLHLDYVQAIGMVSIETVDLELRLADLFARTIGVSLRVGQSIFLSPKAEQIRIDIFRNAAHAEFATAPRANPNHTLIKQKRQALAKIDKLLNRSLDLIRVRHRIIHDDWNISDKEKVVTRRHLDGAIGRERTPIKITELEQHIRSLRVLIDDIYALSVEFKARHPSMASMAIERPANTASKKSTTNSG